MSQSGQDPGSRARRGRNLLLALALFAFVVLVFVMSIAKLSSHGLAH